MNRYIGNMSVNTGIIDSNWVDRKKLYKILRSGP